RWQKWSLNVSWPSASPINWCPRQTPKSGTAPSRFRIVSTWSVRTAGSPGPLAISTTRGFVSRIASASHEPGTTYASRPACARRCGIERFEPRSTTVTRGPAPTENGSCAPTWRSSERPAVDRRLGERARVQLVDRRVAERAADDALVADPAHERARVDPCEGDDAALAQPACELRADVAHHDALALDAVGLHPRLVDAVGADQRIGETQDLGDVARVGDRLLVARHRRREARLARGDAGRAHADPVEDGPVLEHQSLHSLHGSA